ncbi:MAG: ATP-binding response regulator [Pseudobdellovibrionaceae bacterium]
MQSLVQEDSKKTDPLQKFSQELRPYVNTMLGFASLLKDSTLQKNDRDHFIDQIISNGDNILQILENAIQYSKIEIGDSSIKPLRFNISEMVFDIVQAMESGAEQKNIDIHVIFRNPIPETIISDPLKIRQILTNILGNAIRYAGDEGFILISLDYKVLEGGNSQFIIEVDDSAAAGGSLQRDLSNLEDVENLMLSSESALLQRPGLNLSQKFAEALGGYLNIKPSSLGKGHCFSLTVPAGNNGNEPFLKKRKIASFKQKVFNTLKKSNRLKNTKILLAEDSSMNEAIISSYLNKEGANLTFVNNGLEAVDAVKNKDFDLILMDIQMPLLDGLEATRQIRQLGFQKPIVALTGQAFRNDVEKSLMAGCDTHLTKPIEKNALIEEIQKRIL